MIINDRLRRSDDLAALRLAEEYPADLNPDIAYGRVLALFRLGRIDEAEAAIRDAVVDLPKIPLYLSAKRVRQPKLDSFGVRVGGDDQAWLYRQEMRGVWEATPGAGVEPTPPDGGLDLRSAAPQRPGFSSLRRFRS